jgi:hypothetical protein
MGRGCAHVWRSVGIASPDDCSCCEFEGCSRHRPRAGSSLADAPRGTGRRSSGASVVVRHDRTRARGRPWRSQPWASRGTPRMRWVCRGPSRPCRARARPARRTISPSGHASRDDVVENERGFALGQPRPRGKPYGKLGCGPVHARCPTDRWSIDNNSPPDRLCQPTWQALAAGFALPAMRQAQRSVAGNNTAVQSSEVAHDPRQRARGGFEREQRRAVHSGEKSGGTTGSRAKSDTPSAPARLEYHAWLVKSVFRSLPAVQRLSKYCRHSDGPSGTRHLSSSACGALDRYPHPCRYCQPSRPLSPGNPGNPRKLHRSTFVLRPSRLGAGASGQGGKRLLSLAPAGGSEPPARPSSLLAEGRHRRGPRWLGRRRPRSHAWGEAARQVRFARPAPQGASERPS